HRSEERRRSVQLAITGIVGLTISAAVERWDQPMTLPTLGWLVASIVIATSLRFGLQMKVIPFYCSGFSARHSTAIPPELSHDVTALRWPPAT
ncbi:hypothetical protein FK513_28215, partial [Klebsiella pneumoniae]|nr:hypothetical protein [Klebsiella pneumoniae]